MKLKELERGRVFELGGHEWIVLEQNKEATLAITNECIDEMEFDKNNSNDFRNSSIRQYLNEDFLEELVDNGLNAKDILLTDFDLTNSDRKNIYGYCRDRIGLLSQEQFLKHKDILDPGEWWWLITPDASSSRGVRHVSTSGSLNYYIAYFGNNGVRPLCNLKSDIEIEAESIVTNVLETYLTEELLQELLRREKEDED